MLAYLIRPGAAGVGEGAFDHGGSADGSSLSTCFCSQLVSAPVCGFCVVTETAAVLKT